MKFIIHHSEYSGIQQFTIISTLQQTLSAKDHSFAISELKGNTANYGASYFVQEEGEQHVVILSGAEGFENIAHFKAMANAPLVIWQGLECPAAMQQALLGDSERDWPDAIVLPEWRLTGEQHAKLIDITKLLTVNNLCHYIPSLAIETSIAQSQPYLASIKDISSKTAVSIHLSDDLTIEAARDLAKNAANYLIKSEQLTDNTVLMIAAAANPLNYEEDGENYPVTFGFTEAIMQELNSLIPEENIIGLPNVADRINPDLAVLNYLTQAELGVCFVAADSPLAIAHAAEAQSATVAVMAYGDAICAEAQALMSAGAIMSMKSSGEIISPDMPSMLADQSETAETVALQLAHALIEAVNAKRLIADDLFTVSPCAPSSPSGSSSLSSSDGSVSPDVEDLITFSPEARVRSVHFQRSSGLSPSPSKTGIRYDEEKTEAGDLHAEWVATRSPAPASRSSNTGDLIFWSSAAVVAAVLAGGALMLTRGMSNK